MPPILASACHYFYDNPPLHVHQSLAHLLVYMRYCCTLQEPVITRDQLDTATPLTATRTRINAAPDADTPVIAPGSFRRCVLGDLRACYTSICDARLIAFLALHSIITPRIPSSDKNRAS